MGVLSYRITSGEIGTDINETDETFEPFFLDAGARASCGGNEYGERDQEDVTDSESDRGERFRIETGTERGPFDCATAAPEVGSSLLEGLKRFPACGDREYWPRTFADTFAPPAALACLGIRPRSDPADHIGGTH